jgi:hypothetical protein
MEEGGDSSEQGTAGDIDAAQRLFESGPGKDVRLKLIGILSSIDGVETSQRPMSRKFKRGDGKKVKRDTFIIDDSFDLRDFKGKFKFGLKVFGYGEKLDTLKASLYLKLDEANKPLECALVKVEVDNSIVVEVAKGFTVDLPIYNGNSIFKWYNTLGMDGGEFLSFLTSLIKGVATEWPPIIQCLLDVGGHSYDISFFIPAIVPDMGLYRITIGCHNNAATPLFRRDTKLTIYTHRKGRLDFELQLDEKTDKIFGTDFKGLIRNIKSGIVSYKLESSVLNILEQRINNLLILSDFGS